MDRQIDRQTDIGIETYFKELAHVVTESEKSQVQQ